MPFIGYSTNEEQAAVVSQLHCNDSPNMNSKYCQRQANIGKIFDIKKEVQWDTTCRFLPICID
jgi:hypothetical protein